MKVDYLIVGSGLSGAVIARKLHDLGYRVLIVERRSHVGGNVHDHINEHGIRIHTYGPHYFRTSSEKIWSFVNQFSSFYRYEACLKSFVDGAFEQWPIAQSYLLRTVGKDWTPSFIGEAKNFEEASLAMMPKVVYEKFVKGYSEKQWGVAAASLDSGLAGRFDVRLDDEPRLKTQKYQGIPTQGYAHFTQKLIEGIPLWLNFDYLKDKNAVQVNNLTVFTGPIDEYFNFDLGRLHYRGQNRTHQFIADHDFVLPTGQVNYPAVSDGPHVRTLEWKHMMPAHETAHIRGTTITTETPFTPEVPDLYEYPFPDAMNRILYESYKAKADAVPNLLVCGRLGEYKYFDMDQAIARAFVLTNRILALRQISAIEATVGVTSKILDGFIRSDTESHGEAAEASR